MFDRWNFTVCSVKFHLSNIYRKLGRWNFTEQTVKFHLSNIYRKLGVSNRTEATRFAYRNGLIE